MTGNGRSTTGHHDDGGEGDSTDGRQTRWQEHNEARRARIIEAAVAQVEAGEPGAEVNVASIAARAGLSRSVLYRLFDDRADLDRAVQAHVLDELWARLLPALELRGTIPQIAERTVRAYVDWAVEHPALHLLADHDTTTDGDGPLQQRLEMIALRVADTVYVALELMGGSVGDQERARIEGLVFGVVGGVFATVRRWVHQPRPELTAQDVIELASDTVWAVLEFHARQLGVTIDPDKPVQQLLDEATR